MSQQLCIINTLSKINIYIHLILNELSDYTSFYTYKCLNNSQYYILNTTVAACNYYSINAEITLLRRRTIIKMQFCY